MNQADLSEKPKLIKTFMLGSVEIDVCPGRDTLWVIARRPGKGGVVLRTNPWPGPYQLTREALSDTRGVWEVKASVGTWSVEISVVDETVLRAVAHASHRPPAGLLAARPVRAR